MDSLEIARKKICEIDKQMAKLFCERMNAAKEVAEYKKEHGLPIFDPSREEFLINKNSKLVENEDLKPYYIDFLKSNMDISKKYQYRLNEGLKVAYSGVKGAFAEIAAKNIFKESKYIANSDFKKAYLSVEDGECDCVMLPLENSYNGDVGQVLDLAFFGSLYINGIYDFAIKQCLIAKPGTNLNDVKEVLSHSQALGQCSEFINKYNLKVCECVNTAVAAKQVAQSSRKDIAAIASEDAAKEFGLNIIEGSVNNDATNTTRFAVFSRSMSENHKNDNEFIMLFTVKHEQGSLGNALSVISKYGFNLKALKSRPTKDLIWSYYFYVEGEGNIFSENGKALISELGKICDKVKIVGSFEKQN